MRRRLVCSAMAREGHGKTQFALSGPRPLLVLACDPNTEDVVCKTFKVDTIDDLDPEACRLVHVPFPLVGFESREQDVMNEALDSWDILTQAIGEVVRGRAHVQPRTVVLDSGTELHALNILKDFGRTDQLPPAVRRNKMGKTNNDFKGVFRALERAGVHVIVTHRCKEHWETVSVRGGKDEDRPVPGKFDRIGFREMGNLCNVEVLLKFDPDREGKLSDRYGLEVVRSMQRPALIGQEWWGRVEAEGGGVIHTATVAHLGMQLFPGTGLEDWR